MPTTVAIMGRNISGKEAAGKVNELAGKATQAVGDASDNRSMEAKGAAQ